MSLYPSVESLTPADRKHLEEFPDVMKRSKLLVDKMLRIISQQARLISLLQSDVAALQRELNRKS